MANRACVGCGRPLTKDSRSREHILAEWLAEEIKVPDLDLKHYRHDRDEPSNELLRQHALETFVVKNVCNRCNNGWMSRLEQRAKPLLLLLMHMQASLLQLSAEDRTTISAWAIKTAFMIASAQRTVAGDLPWPLFRRMAEHPEAVPRECFVLAAQLPFLPKGFLYAAPGDTLSSSEDVIQIRVGFSIHHIHFVVVIPMATADRIVAASPIHVPLWPLDLEILVRYQFFPTVDSSSDLINFLTDAMQAAIVTRNP